MEIRESLWCIGGSLTKVRAGTSHPFFSTFHFQEIFKFLDFLCTTWKFCNNQWIVVFRKYLLSKNCGWRKSVKVWLPFQRHSLPKLAYACLCLCLQQGCILSSRVACLSYRGLCSVCLISTTTEILSNWWFSWVATEFFRFDRILGFEGGYLKQVCNYCNRVYILHQRLLFSRWLRALPRLCDAGERCVHFVTRNCSLQCHTLFCLFRLSPTLPSST